METWQFYATRGIVKSYRFDNSQIEKGLEIGISPEIKISHKHLTAPIQRDFALYGKRMGLKELELSASIEPSPENVEESLSRLNQYTIWVRGANDIANERLINAINFHVGSAQDYDSEREYKKRTRTPNDFATFDAEEYLKRLDALKEFYKHVDELSSKSGITVLVENMPNPNFAKAESLEDKKSKYRYIDRWSGTRWVPEYFQHGSMATSGEINHVLGGTGIQICYDIEHLNQTIESSSRYPNEGSLESLLVHEAELFEKFGLIVRKGETLRFKSKLDIEQQITDFRNPIKSSQIGGQVGMAFMDSDGYFHIGSHMPLTPTNIYIMDERQRQKMWEDGREYVKQALQALKSKGCRRITFEVFPYDYAGEDWVKMNQETFSSVKQILSEI